MSCSGTLELFCGAGCCVYCCHRLMVIYVLPYDNEQNPQKESAKIIDQLENAKSALEELKEEESRDNMPENLQNSERYERAEEACNDLDNAVSHLEDAIIIVESAIE